MAYPQGTIIAARHAFGMRRSNKGRAAQVRQGERFWVTNSEAGRDRAFNGLIMIDREGKGQISCGFALSPEQLGELFEEVK